MPTNPHPVEIDQHTMKLIVGVIAVSLPVLTSLFSEPGLESISASYHEGYWSRDIFVGFLFAISAFLLAYNGYSKTQMIQSKIAAFAAVGIAMFPCKCGAHPEVIPYVHGISAAIMFVILAIFCYIFYQRARGKGHGHATFRAGIYALCGIVIVGSMLAIATSKILPDSIGSTFDRITFFGEAAGLIAFGIAWLVASRKLPLITRADERLPLLPLGIREANVDQGIQ